MARKTQKDYLADLLSEEDQDSGGKGAIPNAEPGLQGENAPSPPSNDRHPHANPTQDISRRRGTATTLLGRESAIARVATGQVKQVTQLLLDPAKVRIWPGNARVYEHLTEESCKELIDSIVAEGGQKVPAVVRRIDGDSDYEYEVIAGTRRHWAISWLRQHSYPEMHFLAQVAQLDDEAAFRLADLENRARQDVSDIERARNYAAALKDHYGNHLTRMAERLKLSKGWLSKMLKVATIPDEVLAAFSSPADVLLKPAYPLAQALADEQRAKIIVKEAQRIAGLQAKLSGADKSPLPSSEVIARLLSAGEQRKSTEKISVEGAHGRPAVTVQSSNRQGVTVRLHSGHGLDEGALLQRISDALSQLESDGRGLQR